MNGFKLKISVHRIKTLAIFVTVEDCSSFECVEWSLDDGTRNLNCVDLVNKGVCVLFDIP